MRTPVIAAIGVAVAIAAVAILVFVIGGGGTPSSLPGSKWHLTAYTETTPAFQGVVPPEEQSLYTIDFGTNGTFTAQADCNQVAGTFETSGSDKLTIVVGPSTQVACPDGSLGGVYAHALDNAETYVIANGQLTITLSGGGSLTYSPGAAPVVPTASPS
ncbi:MAG: META domain-containing protein, partial [Candidatus Limnocylindrales bacterium]